MTDIVKQVTSYFSYLCHPEPAITLVTKAFQQQKDGVDCGLFAIAFATTLAFGGDPVTIAYGTLFSRQHLLKCLDLTRWRIFHLLKRTFLL